MASERTKPLTDSVALAGELSERGSGFDDLPKRIERYGKAKRRTGLNIQYLSNPVDLCIDEVGYLKRRLEACGNWLVFRNYYTVGETRLAKARFCMKHLLCPLCAIRRGAKSLAAYLDRFNEITSKNPRLVPYLLTLTVTNGEDLQERFDHLVKSWKSYHERRRDWLKKGRGFNELCKVEGAVFSYEFTFSDKGWHPHLHAIILVDPDQLIDFDFKASGLKKSQSRLSQEWLSITGDSSIVDCRPIDTQDPAKSFAEVFKYALKFSDLPPKENYHAYAILKGKRLQGSFGLFWGVKVPDKLTDELLDDELPYIELFYKYTDAGYSVTHHHHHTGGQIPQVRIISPLDERSDNALAKAENYRSNAWWLIEKRERESQ
ncbi:protein rep [Sphaerisporangium sp. NPDC088356]|uniref:protein rep n=1 Tax=Sphaerisporangium sp. NPDC088356 TaxID=3154871 RepID=UPI0034404B09